ncbi:MAG TPA: D-arabinono-1,4-lactone oxidase [Pilimelia sp.]|nr:D-arabinono-1,4-lactone oxidase [Pilimelia sp.]
MTAPQRNWAGNVTYGAARFHRPTTLAELRGLLAASRRARAVGTGHSFNRIADTTGDLISVAGLPRTVRLDRAAGTVTVSAGIRYGELATHLHAAGFGLPNLGSLPHISVAGACATGTHGSGERNKGLATAVTGLDLATAGGELLTLTRAADGDRFAGAVVGLGALGVVTSLTLAVVPSFDVRQYVYDDLPWDSLISHFDEIAGAAYSVSVFVDWAGPRAKQVWLKQRLGGPDAGAPPRRWLGATLADGPRHPVPGVGPEPATEQLGVPGPWHTRLPHFRPEFTPSAGAEVQSEYLLPRGRALAALAAVAAVRDSVAPALQVCEIRTIAADDLWLSPSYGRDTVALHFTWVPAADAVARAVTAVEGALAPLDARPHWGKVFTLDPAVVRAQYDRLPDFARLRGEVDPDGVCRNEFVDRYVPAAP